MNASHPNSSRSHEAWKQTLQDCLQGLAGGLHARGPSANGGVVLADERYPEGKQKADAG